MRIDRDNAHRLLKDFDFGTLFIEELGWDRYSQTLLIQANEVEYTLTVCAEKRGMVAFCCAAPSADAVPDYATRSKIEREVARSVHEHLIIYTDHDNTAQIWQWVKRETGRPAQRRELTFDPTHQGGEALIQRLESIAFSLEEEGDITLVDVTSRVRGAFDVEKVTKRFYDHFKKEHDGFLKFLSGIPDEGMQRWYVSVILNRLMFIYFIQKKASLMATCTICEQISRVAGKPAQTDTTKPSSARSSLRGLPNRKNERSTEMRRLLGNVPYLNGGIFQKHQIEERHGQTIQIPDAAFERLFAFFERYQCTLTTDR